MRADRLAMILGPLAVILLIAALAGSAFAEAAWVLLTSLPWALGWLAAAFGFGGLADRILRTGGDPLVRAGLGVAAMLVLDAALGTLGVLQWGGSLGAWALIVAGVGLLIGQLRASQGRDRVPPWIAWTAAPGLAVLLLAACAAPSWLWSTEYGGYDALSYHLQLPAEWHRIGRITGLEHNVYSFLPGYVEAAYYHLVVLMGDGLGAVFACQQLHALLTLLAAGAAARLAARLAGPVAGGTCAAIVLGTPWAVVVGSLAYNEMAVALMLASGLLLLVGREEAPSPRTAAAAGALAAAACGAKLTGLGFAAAPLGVLLLAAAPPRRWPVLAAAAIAAGAVVLLPYFARNAVEAGNPVFPFLAPLLGTGHWTAEQARAWLDGHFADAGLAARLVALWNEFLRFGIGPPPGPGVRWLPQWSVLPWLAAGGLAGALAARSLRPAGLRLGAVLAIQLLFWLAATHLKSRFLLPAIVPAAIATALGLDLAIRRVRALSPRLAAGATAASLLLWCGQPVAIFLRETNGGDTLPLSVGRTDLLSGAGLAPAELEQAAELFPGPYLNRVLGPGTRTLLVGEATPLYYEVPVVYRTTWDRGPLSAVMRKHPDAPQQWIAGLRARGFTHVLVNVVMLEIWHREGWNDPLVTSQRIVTALQRHAALEHEFPNGLLLYRLDQPDL